MVNLKSTPVQEYDILVIGAGSGGATIALEAATRGARCAIFENRDVGGTCVHRGCVPKKLFWHAADIIRHCDYAKAYGVDLAVSPTIDYSRLHRNSRVLTDGIGDWYMAEFKRVGARLIRHTARFVDPNTIEADGALYRGERIVLATGSKPITPDLPGGELALTSDELFDMERLPPSVTIVGSGFIAIELACQLNACGVKVRVVVRTDSLSRNFDQEMTALLARHLQHQGIKILTQRRVKSLIKNSEDRVRIGFDTGQADLTTHSVLWAVGRKANLDGLNLAASRVRLDDRGYVAVDENQQTSATHIFALGDVCGRNLLTPVAIKVARTLIRRWFDRADVHFDYTNIPSAIYAHPPLASIGPSEKMARMRYGDDLLVWRNRFRGLHNILHSEEVPPVMIKLLTLKSNDRVIALHLLAPNADEIMQGFAVAFTMGVRKADLDRCVALHPTIAEEIVTLKTEHLSVS